MREYYIHYRKIFELLGKGLCCDNQNFESDMNFKFQHYEKHYSNFNHGINEHQCNGTKREKVKINVVVAND